MSDIVVREWENRIYKWAKDRGLLETATCESQFMYLLTEYGELNAAVLKMNMDKIIDGIGDCAVVLAMLAICSDNTAGESQYELVSEIEIPPVEEKMPSNRMEVIHLGQSIFLYSNAVIEVDHQWLRSAYICLKRIARAFGLNLSDCMEAAWKEIAGRTGKSVNGVFIKDEVKSY